MRPVIAAIRCNREILEMTKAQVARRYAMSANMIHTWLRGPRFAPVAEELVVDAVFLPIGIDGSATHEPVCQELTAPRLSAPVTASRIDITLSDGRCILVEGLPALTAFVSLVQGQARSRCSAILGFGCG